MVFVVLLLMSPLLDEQSRIPILVVAMMAIELVFNANMNFVTILRSNIISFERKILDDLTLDEKINFTQIQEKYHFWGMPLLLLGQFVMHLAMLERSVMYYMSASISNIQSYF